MVHRIFTVVGARPQFIKAAAISREFAKRDGMEETIVHTGQHYDANMSDIFFQELEIPTPKFHLKLGGGSHGQMTGRMLEQLEAIFIAEKPDAVLIYGDTNSTLAAALAAVKLHIPVIHVEAGLRSFNRAMPEEINRILSDQVSSLLYCPTQISVNNLETENITDGVHFVGDVMYDATLFAIEKASSQSSILKELNVENQDYAVVTLHRAENTNDLDRLKKLLSFLEDQASSRKTLFAVHPRTRNVLKENGLELKNITMIDPVGYIDLHALLAKCSLVITDSGGLQKEAYFHKKPCITMRDETEWVETIEAGWNRLWTAPDWVGDRSDIEDYGKGNASEIIVSGIRDYLKA